MNEGGSLRQGPQAAVGGWRAGDGLLMRDLFLWEFSKIGAGTGKENKGLWLMDCDVVFQTKLEDFLRWKAEITYWAYLHFVTSMYLINGGRFVKKPSSRCVF